MEKKDLINLASEQLLNIVVDRLCEAKLFGIPADNAKETITNEIKDYLCNFIITYGEHKA